jgi:ABC-type polysaccharide/polyol phosphate transport system ATPase subunit
MRSSEPPLSVQLTKVTKRFSDAPRRSVVLSKLFHSPEYMAAPVLHAVSLRLPRNKIIGLTGDNGAGKTTLLKIMAGILQPDAGEVKLFGKICPVLELGAGLHPYLSGRENLWVYGSLLGINLDHLRKNVQAIIDFSGLSDHMHEPLHQYSAGMRARLAFSIAVHGDAEILLLDEILAVGDAHFKELAITKLLELKQTKTIIMTSHDLQALGQICDVHFSVGGSSVRSNFDSRKIEKVTQRIFRTTIDIANHNLRKPRDAQVFFQKVLMRSIKKDDVLVLNPFQSGYVGVYRVAAKVRIGGRTRYLIEGSRKNTEDFWLLNEADCIGRVVHPPRS